MRSSSMFEAPFASQPHRPCTPSQKCIANCSHFGSRFDFRAVTCSPQLCASAYRTLLSAPSPPSATSRPSGQTQHLSASLPILPHPTMSFPVSALTPLPPTPGPGKRHLGIEFGRFREGRSSGEQHGTAGVPDDWGRGFGALRLGRLEKVTLVAHDDLEVAVLDRLLQLGHQVV
eukprot:113568-Rhodomonas_salina.1